MKAWDGAGIVEAEMGLDWRGECGWTSDFDNDKLFRAIEYGAMCVGGSTAGPPISLNPCSQGGIQLNVPSREELA